MEMEQSEGNEGELDHKAGEDQRPDAPADSHEDAVIPTLEQAARPGSRVQRDDRGDRGEAHLEARTGERFGPEHQHDQRTHGDQPDAERIAAERDPGKDQQRRDAATDRRHLGAGEEGVADACRGGDRSGHQHEVEAQRQSLAQRQELEAEKHRRGNHGGDVQSADRQQMRKPAAPHRLGIRLADGILVAGHEGDGDPRLSALQPAVNMARQPLPNRIEPAARAGPDQLDRPQRLAHRAYAAEPGVAGEVVGPGHRHRGRRHQPGASERPRP